MTMESDVGTIEYFKFTPIDGHKKKKVTEDEALKMINAGLQKGRYILIECEDGTTLSSANAVATDKSHKKRKPAKKDFKSKVKALLGCDEKKADKEKKESKVKKISEIMPISGG